MFKSRRKMMLAGAGATMVAALAFAPAASAHECFQKQWTDAAYAQAVKSDRYMSLGTLADMFVISGIAPDCVGKLDYDALLAGWMERNGITHMPLIWVHETPEASGNAWMNPSGNSGPGLLGSGKESKAIGYLGNHIPVLEGILMTGLQEAVEAGVCEFPPPAEES